MDLPRASGIRLDWIASFVAVAHEGGFSAAAKALYRSQPRVSTHVAELEHALGTRLFDRTLQPAALTPEGRALLPHAEEILARLDLLAEMTSAPGGPLRGEVRLGAYPSAATFLYSPAVRLLERVHPHLALVLREAASVELGALLASGAIDLAIRPVLPLVSDDRLTCRVLWSEPLVAVMLGSSPLASAPEITLARLAQVPLVTIGDRTPGIGRQFETNLAFAHAGLVPTIAYQTNQPQTLVSLVRHGLGVGLTNALAMTTSNTDGVVLRPLPDVAARRQVAVWWRTDQPASRSIDGVRALLAELPRPSWPWDGEPAGPPGGHGAG